MGNLIFIGKTCLMYCLPSIAFCWCPMGIWDMHKSFCMFCFKGYTTIQMTIVSCVMYMKEVPKKISKPLILYIVIITTRYSFMVVSKWDRGAFQLNSNHYAERHVKYAIFVDLTPFFFPRSVSVKGIPSCKLFYKQILMRISNYIGKFFKRYFPPRVSLEKRIHYVPACVHWYQLKWHQTVWICYWKC